MPPEYAHFKVGTEVLLILLGVTVNIRGVKDAVLPLVPIFLLFIVTHALLWTGPVLQATSGEASAWLVFGAIAVWFAIGVGLTAVRRPIE